MGAKPGRRVTMADVAREAGVSIASASRAINGAPGVSDATKARIRDIAQRLEFVPSPEASALSSGATGRVGVLIAHVSRWYNGAALEGIESTLAQRGFDTVVYGINDPADRRRFFDRLPARRKVDGVIVVGMPVTGEERERLSLLGVRIVAVGGQNADYPYVSIDDERAGQQAMDHLVMLGHRRIAMIDAIDPHEQEWPIELRSRAYHAALEAIGVEVDDEYFVRVPWGAAGGEEGMRRLLSLRQPPTAVYVHSDDMAFGALAVARRAGLRVPSDLSVVSIDDHPVSATLDLTTVAQDPYAQGVMGAKELADAIVGKTPPGSTIVPTVLIPRGSTAPPREQRRLQD